jgi:hypothetical protein
LAHQVIQLYLAGKIFHPTAAGAGYSQAAIQAEDGRFDPTPRQSHIVNPRKIDTGKPALENSVPRLTVLAVRSVPPIRIYY